ncbi:hypothetical protein [Streptomyces sp. NPDC003522]
MPPPPASARFPDGPPPGGGTGGSDDDPSRTGARGPQDGPRPAAADGGRRAAPEATRPAGTAKQRAPRSDGFPPATGPDGAAPVTPDRATGTGAPGPGPARPGVPRPARLDGTRPPHPAPATGPQAPRPAVRRPARLDAARPTDPAAVPADTPRPAAPEATDPDRTPAPPGPPAAPRERAADRPRPPAPGTAWTPLPRSWAPAPGQHRDGLSTAVPGRHPEADAPPAWSPATPLRHPGFDTPSPAAGAGVDPALSWSAPGPPGATRPVVTFAAPEGYGDAPRAGRRGLRGRTVAAAACAVLGLGLIGGAVTGSWLVGDPADAGERSVYATAGGLWHNVPVDRLFPPAVDGQGAGPGGADRTWTRIAVAPDSGCADAFDPLLAKALAPVGCARLLRATYTDATRSFVTTVGLLFTKADAAGMRALDTRFDKEGLAGRTDLMPRPYGAKGTLAAAFGDAQRASWTVSVLTDTPVVVYAVSGWADGRTVAAAQSAVEATASGATTAVAQAGAGHEAKGLADRIERGLRKTAVSPSEPPS